MDIDRRVVILSHALALSNGDDWAVASDADAKADGWVLGGGGDLSCFACRDGTGSGARCDSGRIRVGEVGDGGRTKKKKAGTLCQDVDRQGEIDRRGIGDGRKGKK